MPKHSLENTDLLELESQIHRISSKLTAFGYLLETQADSSAGIPELAGLGSALCDFAEELLFIANQMVE
jgi:hypothetical protein